MTSKTTNSSSGLPLQAENAADFLLKAWDDKRSIRRLQRLLGRRTEAMATTWQRIGSALGQDGTMEQWRHLFDLLATLHLSIDHDLKSALRQVDGLGSDIRSGCIDLAGKIQRYNQICEHHGIDKPEAAVLLDGLVAAAYRNRRTEDCWGWYVGALCPQGVNDGYCASDRPLNTIDNGSEIAWALEVLADALKAHEHRPTTPLGAADSIGNASLVSDYVRHFDAKLELYKSASLLPEAFEVNSADLALLLDVLLEGEVEHDERSKFNDAAVRTARNRIKDRTL